LSHTKQGYPHWNWHPAKEHLEDNVHNNIAGTMLQAGFLVLFLEHSKYKTPVFGSILDTISVTSHIRNSRFLCA
jgi:hypothetical protein